MISHHTHFGVAGEYTLTRRRASDMSVIETLGPFKNNITNIGLERVGTDTAMTNAYVGSGTTAAANGDTQMVSFLAGTGSILTSSSNRTLASPYWVEQSQIFRLPPQGMSLNINEVGVGWSSDGNGALWSRARTVDGSNNPVTITLLADEYLDITYTLRFYPQLGDATYNVTISSVVYSFTARQAYVTSRTAVNADYPFSASQQVTAFGGPCTLGAVTDGIQGATDSALVGYANASPYVPNSKKLSYSLVATPSEGNVIGGIKGLEMSPLTTSFLSAATQFVVTPVIPKDNTKSLSLAFEYSWDRY